MQQNARIKTEITSLAHDLPYKLPYPSIHRFILVLEVEVEVDTKYYWVLVSRFVCFMSWGEAWGLLNIKRAQIPDADADARGIGSGERMHSGESKRTKHQKKACRNDAPKLLHAKPTSRSRTTFQRFNVSGQGRERGCMDLFCIGGWELKATIQGVTDERPGYEGSSTFPKF
ncbi:hypothetical protein BOTCAL_0143g00060 [Botryotinia calthae]|uniref:Uncharacterized protein n=1 Tax=Botryotinia calthae TaxID=38488 RepID=A0A4Y8D516_9HELO|nr:hypothetical protein BOTCAL_0143g00060 [Botryotinia calthae]